MHNVREELTGVRRSSMFARHMMLPAIVLR
jgi:hypothetical protein